MGVRSQIILKVIPLTGKYYEVALCFPKEVFTHLLGPKFCQMYIYIKINAAGLLIPIKIYTKKFRDKQHAVCNDVTGSGKGNRGRTVRASDLGEAHTKVLCTIFATLLYT